MNDLEKTASNLTTSAATIKNLRKTFINLQILIYLLLF